MADKQKPGQMVWINPEDLAKEIEKYKARIAELEKENAVLKDRLKRLGENSPF